MEKIIEDIDIGFDGDVSKIEYVVVYSVPDILYMYRSKYRAHESGKTYCKITMDDDTELVFDKFDESKILEELRKCVRNTDFVFDDDLFGYREDENENVYAYIEGEFNSDIYSSNEMGIIFRI